LFGRQAQQFVQGPPFLERARQLEILQLEEDLAPAEVAELLGINQGGTNGILLYVPISGFNVAWNHGHKMEVARGQS
jgi:hypothetical protein